MICPTCKRTFEHPHERPSGPPPARPSGPPPARPSGPPPARPSGPPNDAGRPHFGPFCSERCRSADLGNWLDGNYRIANSADADEDDDGLAAAARSDDSSGDAIN